MRRKLVSRYVQQRGRNLCIISSSCYSVWGQISDTIFTAALAVRRASEMSLDRSAEILTQKKERESGRPVMEKTDQIGTIPVKPVTVRSEYFQTTGFDMVIRRPDRSSCRLRTLIATEWGRSQYMERPLIFQLGLDVNSPHLSIPSICCTVQYSRVFYSSLNKKSCLSIGNLLVSTIPPPFDHSLKKHVGELVQ